jgi:UDP-N-acetyl-D-galactosamine dehydrogenase
MAEPQKIGVIGLGYVGLPLAIHLAKHFSVVGLDIDLRRVDELKGGHDRTREIEPALLIASTMEFTTDVSAIRGSDIFIVTVPTPVDDANEPDLTAVKGASRLVGGVIQKGAIVVYESTVYPGVTEDVAGPELEAASGLKCGIDFFLGYSPERINPGDREHTVDRITKVVAARPTRLPRPCARCTESLRRAGSSRRATFAPLKRRR